MSLDFCCDIQMVGIIWHKKHESMDPSCLVSTVQAAGGGVMVWGIFSWHTLGPLVPIEHRLNAAAYLSIVAGNVNPVKTTVYPSSDGYFQQDNAPCRKAQNHLRLVSSTWQWVFHFTQKDSTVTRSQSNRAPLGCGGMGDSHHICAADKICSNCVMLSCQYGPNYLRNVSKTLLNLCHEELSQFWR